MTPYLRAPRLDAPPVPIPTLVQMSYDELTATSPAGSGQHRAIIVRYTVATDQDPLLDVEAHTTAIVAWAQDHGPFEALGQDREPDFVGRGDIKLL